MSQMRGIRRAVVALGAISVIAGLGIVFTPGPPVPVTLDSVIISLVGLLAFVQGGRLVAGRLRATRRRATTATPERRHRVPVPGDGFDERLSKGQARDRLRKIALTTFVRHEGCSSEEARARLSEGTWTDDRIAAAVLGLDTSRLPLTTRLRAATMSEEDKRRRAVDAIRRLREGS